jgi:hypothetical protein
MTYMQRNAIAVLVVLVLLVAALLPTAALVLGLLSWSLFS